MDFPIRGPDAQLPVLNPPPMPPRHAPAQQGAVLQQGAYVQAPAGAYPPAAAAGPHGYMQQQPAVDPFAGMSEEDKRAVQAAMAEMDREERAARETGGMCEN